MISLTSSLTPDPTGKPAAAPSGLSGSVAPGAAGKPAAPLPSWGVGGASPSLVSNLAPSASVVAATVPAGAGGGVYKLPSKGAALGGGGGGGAGPSVAAPAKASTISAMDVDRAKVPASAMDVDTHPKGLIAAVRAPCHSVNPSRSPHAF